MDLRAVLKGNLNCAKIASHLENVKIEPKLIRIHQFVNYI
jgi:hypothetical protein